MKETSIKSSEKARNLLASRLATFVIAFAATGFCNTATAEKPAMSVTGVASGYSVPASDVAGKRAANGIYLVRFSEPAISRYKGGVAGLRATSPRSIGAQKIDANHPDVKAYNRHLNDHRKDFRNSLRQTLRRDAETVFDYRYAKNGVAMKLTPAEAKKIAAMNGVVSVEADILLPLNTDSGPNFIGAAQLWDGTATNDGLGTQGEGIVIGIIDSGVNSDHPSFAAVGGDGYAHTNPYGSGNYRGRCGLNTSSPNYFGGCNAKLVGAHDYVDVTNPEEGNDGPEDDNGHGSHTASTAGGNIVTTALNAPTINLNLQVSGVAPHANIIMCDACYTNGAGQGLCPGSATTACVDALIADGVDVINYSIGGGVNPWTDDVSQGFLNATAAGVYVAASGGNSGPAAATLGHQEPWVSTTAASSHDSNSRANAVTGLSSNGASLGDINGLGLTSGYGPAPIVYAGDFPNSNDPGGDPAQCLQPYPGGTFNGEIVVCDRGEIARVEKGQNVLDGGAGGYVLANKDDTGESIVADEHFLPGVHIGDADGDVLRAWLASNSNTVATISGTSTLSNPNLGNIMADFSSRGPNTSANVLKPDVTAPGSNIFAAVENGGASSSPEYGFKSGTSMSGPHNAGAGALMKALFPNWTPYAIKSAIMMTAVNDGIRKEDGVTASDPFDRGAGSIDLTKAALTGLIMDETVTNMQDADPGTGGDPATLNIPSMQSGSCAGSCSWSRTFTSVADTTVSWQVSSASNDGLAFSVSPTSFTIAPGASQTVTVNALTADATDQTWSFGEMILTDTGASYPELALPVAVFASTSTNAALITKQVDQAAVTSGDTVRYTINLSNIGDGQNINVTDTLPDGASFVNGSESTNVAGGSTINSLSYNSGDNTVTWDGNLDGVSLSVGPGSSPAGFVSLATEGISPSPCPSNCDDGGLAVDGFSITYLGQTYTEAFWSVNGVLELGTASGTAASASNQSFPSPNAPNNLLAVFWTDMNLDDGGDWYQGDVTIGFSTYRVFSWENIPRYNDPTTYSFQIWLENGTSNIWYVYDRIPAIPAGLTVGFEDSTATSGVNYYFDGSGTAPVVGTDLRVQAGGGGFVELSFDAVVTGNTGDMISNTVDIQGASLSGSAVAITLIDGQSVDSDGDGVNDAADNCTAVVNANQNDSNGDGYGNACDPDINNDGTVNFFDVSMFIDLFLSTDADADFNSDGAVNFFDYIVMQQYFLQPPGPSALAP